MDIMVLFCKGLHICALFAITLMFLFKVHSNKPSENEQNLRSKYTSAVSSSSLHTSLEKE